jgi:glycosyltransferase involved in cell wall biosynthesis
MDMTAAGARHPRRVAFVSTMAGVAWGGSEELWSRTALTLAAAGHAVGACVYEWPSEPEPVAKLAAAGVNVMFRPLRRTIRERLVKKVVGRIAPRPLDPYGMTWLRSLKPDLVAISQGGPWDGVPWMTACARHGIPYCPIVQAHSEDWWPLDESLEEIRSAYSGAKRAYFVSRANFSLMELQCGMRLPNGEVISNPWNVDGTKDSPWPQEDGVTRLACVGRLDPKAKGQDVLLQVLALPKWRERPIQLNLYGSGPCEASLRSLCEMLDLRNVHFAGQVGDVGKIWAENHALVLPSRFEGLPLVIVEAMLCGRPVITSNVAGNAEYLREGITGFIAEAPTPALLDDALERAWSQRAEWEAMGRRARTDVREFLPSDPIGHFADKLLSLAQ